MKINFEKIIINNFLSFGYAELNLKNKGYTLIEGINHNPKDTAESNGSGKSTIFSAVCFALTGETIQGLSSNLRNMFIPDCKMSVELHFSVDKDYFEITRSRDNKDHGDLKIIVNGIDKSGKGLRESEAILNEYIPCLKSDLIGEVIIIGQGMPHKFSSNSPSGRKDLLEKLSNSDLMLADIRERVENRLNILKDKNNQIDNKLIEIQTKENINKANLERKESELNTYENKPDFDSQLNNLNKEIEDLNTVIKDNNEQKLNLNKVLTEYQDILDNLKDEENKTKEHEQEVFNQANLNVKTNITRLKTEITNLKKEINEKENIKDICPLCGQKIPHVHKPDTTELKDKLNILNEEYEKYIDIDKNQLNSFNLNIIDIKNEFNEKMSGIQGKIIVVSSKIKLVEDLEKENLDILKNKEITKSKTEETKKFFEINNKKCLEEVESIKKAIKDLGEEKLYNIHEQEDTKNHIDIVSKMMTYIKRDFRGILLSNVIKYIDNKAKDYSEEIFCTRDLSFKLDGNNINITYLGKPLEALSGGEQQKVDLIMQFAIRSMMQEYTGFSSNILVLDEILDNLDSLGCDKVLEFITNKLSDIESIFIISHHAGSLNIGNDSTITVTKDEMGVSTLYEK